MLFLLLFMLTEHKAHWTWWSSMQHSYQNCYDHTRMTLLWNSEVYVAPGTNLVVWHFHKVKFWTFSMWGYLCLTIGCCAFRKGNLPVPISRRPKVFSQRPNLGSIGGYQFLLELRCEMSHSILVLSLLSVLLSIRWFSNILYQSHHQPLLPLCK